MNDWAWSIKNLARRRLRTVLAVLGIAISAAMLLDMVMLSGSIEKSFADLLTAKGYQIRLAPKGTLPFDTEATLQSAGSIIRRLRPDPAIAAAGAGGFLLAVALAYPRGMGMGDVKLAAVMGLYLGRAVVPALAVAVFAGAVVGMALLARDGSSARKRAVPFGPFLALGGVVGLLAGDEILDWYLDTFAGG